MDTTLTLQLTVFGVLSVCGVGVLCACVICFSKVPYINMLVCFQGNGVYKSVLFSLVMNYDFLQTFEK